MSEKEEITNIENSFGTPPGWLLHNGVWLLTVLLFTILIISYFVKYPDTLSMQAVIHSENAPIDILSKQAGPIQNIYISHNQRVDSNQLMLNISSTLDLNDLESFKKLISQIETSTNYDDILSIKTPNLQLGLINESYFALVKAVEEFKHFYKMKETQTNLHALHQEIIKTGDMVNALSQQENFYENRMVLTQKNLLRSKSLNIDGVVADAELDNTKSEVLQEEIQKGNYTSSKINYEVKIQQLKTEIQLLNSKRETELSNHLFELRQACNKIKNETEKWEDLYLIKSPGEGTISFSRYWTKNSWVKINDTIGTIDINQGLPKMVIIGYLPISNSGQLKKRSIGQGRSR